MTDMAAIPDNPVTDADVALWWQAKLELDKWKNLESLMRPKIFKHFFPDPREGTNTAPLPNGYQMKGIRVINRDVDPGALDALTEQFHARNLNPDTFIARKPTLIISEYRKLTAEEVHLVDQALIVKDGMPQLKVAPGQEGLKTGVAAMNDGDRKKLVEARGKLEEAKELVNEIAEGEQEKFENLSEGLQAAEAGQKMEETAASLADVVSNLEDQISAIVDLE